MKKIYFSAAGTTRRLVEFLAEQTGETGDTIDLGTEAYGELLPGELCLIGVPSFGGRVPSIAAERLGRLKGNGGRAVLAVTYGNRAYEDTLLELKDICEDIGLTVIGAMCVVCEHSILHVFGQGRPDETERRQIAAFMEEVKDKRTAMQAGVPGSRPYKPYGVIPMKIQTKETCTGCGLCVQTCPVHAIDSERPSVIDADRCLSCMHCVSVCPVRAKKTDEEQISMMIEKKGHLFIEPKKNEFYL